MKIYKISCMRPSFSEPGDYLTSVTLRAIDINHAIELALAYKPERWTGLDNPGYFRSQRNDWYIEELGSCDIPGVVDDYWGE